MKEGEELIQCVHCPSMLVNSSREKRRVVYGGQHSPVRVRVVMQNPETSPPGQTEKNRVCTPTENVREAPRISSWDDW